MASSWQEMASHKRARGQQVAKCPDEAMSADQFSASSSLQGEHAWRALMLKTRFKYLQGPSKMTTLGHLSLLTLGVRLSAQG